MIKKNSTSVSFFASIFGLRSKRSRGLGRHQLFGMGGTFGHGVIRHCDSWDLGDETPDRVTVRQDMGEIAQQRREEAIERLSRGKKQGFYDFINR